MVESKEAGDTPASPLADNSMTMQVMFNMEEVHELSMAMLEDLQESGVVTGYGAAALALSLGRLIKGEPMSPEDETKMVQHILDYMLAYHAGGGVN